MWRRTTNTHVHVPPNYDARFHPCTLSLCYPPVHPNASAHMSYVCMTSSSPSHRPSVSMFQCFHMHTWVYDRVVKSCSLSLSLTHFIYNTVLFLCFHCRRNKRVYTYKTHKKDTARMSDFNAVDLPAVVWCCYLSAVVRVDVLGGRGGRTDVTNYSCPTTPTHTCKRMCTPFIWLTLTIKQT